VLGPADARVFSRECFYYLNQGQCEGCLRFIALLAMLVLPPESGRNWLRLALFVEGLTGLT